MSVTIPFSVPPSNVPVTKINVYEGECDPGTGTDICGRDGYVKVYEQIIGSTDTQITYEDGDPTKCYRVSFTNEDGIEGGLSDIIHIVGGDGEMCRPRVSGVPGETLCLNATFYHNGVATDPHAIRKITIYRRAVEEANEVAEIVFPDPSDSVYPLPAVRDPGRSGYYVVLFDVPEDFVAPDIYFDVWHYVPTIPSVTDFDIDDESYWLSQCNRFWVNPNNWYLADHLEVPKLAFEPLDVKFRAGETRWMEVGLQPLPLYDYDYNLIVPLIPYFRPTITIKTKNGETIVENDLMDMGLRQGSYRSNPFVCKWLLDTSRFIIGTYDYRISITLPDGQTVVSPDFTLTIS